VTHLLGASPQPRGLLLPTPQLIVPTGRKAGHRWTGQTESNVHTEGQDIPVEIRWCKRIAGVLEQHYPGYPWFVEVDLKQGIAKVTLPIVFKNRVYVLHLSKIDASGRSIVRAGGEMLERIDCGRARIDSDSFEFAVKRYGGKGYRGGR
jgi:hypothetical protein